MKCSHYYNNCKILAPCCNIIYNCHECHDHKETHKINQRNITQIICNKCNKIQNKSNICINCSNKFSNYYCDICNIWCSSNNTYHCNKCNTCRVGNINNYKHCDKCKVCIHINKYEKHKCFSDGILECPICIESINTSPNPSSILKCGHAIHIKCLNQLIKNNFNKCPICNHKM